MNKIEFKIKFPIQKAWSSENYPLMILDADNVTHYWDDNGNYDGYSMDGCMDLNTRTNKN